jgi:hypothetical protein
MELAALVLLSTSVNYFNGHAEFEALDDLLSSFGLHFVTTRDTRPFMSTMYYSPLKTCTRLRMTKFLFVF